MRQHPQGASKYWWSLSCLVAVQLRVRCPGLKLYIQDRSGQSSCEIHKWKDAARYTVTLRLMHSQIRNDLALVSIAYTMSRKTAGANKTTLSAVNNGQHTFGSPNKWEDCRDHIPPLYQQQPIYPILQIKSKQVREWINRRERSWRSWLVNNEKLLSQLWIVSTPSLSLPHTHVVVHTQFQRACKWFGQTLDH